MDDAFRVLQKKEIYEFLEGSGDQELVQHDGSWYGLPYHTANELDNICRSFGYTDELGGSRWMYMEALFQFAIEKSRCSELIAYLFSLERFDNLQSLSDMDEIDDVVINVAKSDEPVVIVHDEVDMDDDDEEDTRFDGVEED